jgi:L-ribulose-5-phosphate 4-epimerase
MVEDVARTVHISRQLGAAPSIDPSDVAALFERYQNVYGQVGQHTNALQENQR